MMVCPLRVQIFQNGQYFVTAVRVQCARWLISEDHLTAVHQCAGNTDALLLPAGKLAGAIVQAFTQSKAVQQRRRALLA